MATVKSNTQNPPAQSGVKNARWFCAQLGAREHYVVPSVLHQHGQLAALYTDFWAGPITRRLTQATRSNLGRSLAARHHSDLAGAPVVAWNIRSLADELKIRRQQKSAPGTGPYPGFIQAGRLFATRVREHLKRRNDLDSASIFFAYDTGALEALEWCRHQKLRCVVNQMDPGRVEFDLVQAEEQRWPDWKMPAVAMPEAYFKRREQEWALADRVVVNSRWSLDALVKQGVPPEKIVVIPLCYEAAGVGRKSEIRNQKSIAPLRILFLGQVILRKGIQYLWQAAQLLEKENIRFDVVGSIGISAAAVKSAPANLVFHGRATRDQTAAWYQTSDLFVLPTLSDGFALTQLEAMTHGLPVVTTPCCGEVVTPGVDGFVVPPRDATALARAFQRYLAEPELLKAQQSAALLKARQFTRERLGENLMRLEAGLK